MNNYLIGKNKIHSSSELIAFNYVENSVIGKNCELYGCKLKNCIIGDNVEITNSVLQNCTIKDNCTIGPFAYIRENSIINDDCRIGDFVEVKNSNIGKNTKSAHLTYIGDATIGCNCNIGCGTVFANYNGQIKQHITIEDYCFIGANCNLVAPLTIGKQSFLGAGTTIRKDIPLQTFVVNNNENIIKQNNKPNLLKIK